ncbi:hypothetical protein D7Y13_29135 [Corallococcus praedator]|uniref:Lipoprotein n=1 Tax=Corallococcus praedator TaxID=2316724 RepID=A0ABX9QBC5_9BACT|nr:MULTISPECIES: hypothetical protein [Corallococcus]RKH10988.1 hypothetical protein D7X74_26325 [Corallococcus sp. CA047B]RKH25768.1 hypothetical protein D7X75_29490 [Corallococcus sp. CA031C]RKH97981.1 hypothetical protein D7Y13_29135 [Corallococcus praedator]
MSRLIALTSCLAVLLVGCSNDVDAVCEMRKQCIDADLDTGKCADKVSAWEEERESEQESRQERTTECARCVADRTCAEVAANCIGDCIGIP